MYLVKHALLSLPVAAVLTLMPQTSNSQTNRPICSSADSDPDGDGWGWENSTSCVVAASSNDSTQTGTATNQGVDERGRPICSSSSFDSDGDGWGWENNRSCVVSSVTSDDDSSANSDDAGGQVDPEPDQAPVPEPAQEPVQPTPQEPIPAVAAANAGTRNGRPICLTTASVVNNSGFGYENNQTCIVADGITATRSDPLLNQRVCEDWFEIPYGNYRLQNNVWNSAGVFSNNWTQCITLSGSASNPVASWDYNWLGRTQGNEFAVKSYPQIYYGRKTRFNQSASVAETGLPASVNNLPRFTIDFAYSETGNAERNVAFESFFHTSCEAEEHNKQFEMMVWVGVPAIRTPGPIVASARIDGRDWDIHVNPSLGWGYVAFVAQRTRLSIGPATADPRLVCRRLAIIPVWAQ